MNIYDIANVWNADWYRTNHTVIEFLVLSVLFIALVLSALRKQFPDRSGKILSVALGLALAIGLTYAMADWGITFRDLGLLSVGLLALVLGLFVLALVKGKTPGIFGATGVIFLIVLVIGQPSDPGRRLMGTGGLELILPAMVAILVFYFMTKMLARDAYGSGHTGTAPFAPTETAARPSVSLLKATRSHLLQSRWLADQIKKIKGYVSRGASNETDRHAIESAMQRIHQIETDLAVRLKRMEELAKHLEHQDAEQYGELGKFLATVQKGGASPEARRMVLQKDKLRDDTRIYELIHTAAHHVSHVKHCLEKADHCLKENNIERSRQWLDHALTRQTELTAILTELAKWEDRLTALTAATPKSTAVQSPAEEWDLKLDR